MLMSENEYYEFNIKNLSLEEAIIQIQKIISHIIDLENILKNKNRTYLMEPSFDLQLAYNKKYLTYSFSKIIFYNTNTNEIFTFEDWFQKFNILPKFKKMIFNYAKKLKCFKIENELEKEINYQTKFIKSKTSDL